MTVVMAPASAAVSTATAAELCDTAKNARQLAMRGDYDNASVYYGGLLAKLQQYIHALGGGGADAQRRGRWLALQQQLVREFDQVKAIQAELREIAVQFQQSSAVGGGPGQLRRQNYGAPDRAVDPAAFFRADPDVWSPPPSAGGRDPDVWSAPSAGDMRYDNIFFVNETITAIRNRLHLKCHHRPKTHFQPNNNAQIRSVALVACQLECSVAPACRQLPSICLIVVVHVERTQQTGRQARRRCRRRRLIGTIVRPHKEGGLGWHQQQQRSPRHG